MNLPTKSEVMGWNSGNLADYLKRMKLVGCDRTVKKSNMSGARFLNMTDKDLKMFPTPHIPFITKICKDINQNNKEKKSLFHRSDHRKPPNQEPTSGGWDSDEFDQEDSDNDYEEPDNNEFEDNYICAASGDPAENVNSDDDYEAPPSEIPSEIPTHFRAAKPMGDGDYIDTCPRGSARPPQDNSSGRLPRGLLNISKPPSRPDPSPQRPFIPPNQAKPTPAVPTVDRSKKPGSSKKQTEKPAPKKTITMATKPATLPTQRFNMQQMDDFPPPPVEVNEKMEQICSQDMDPQWYVGQISRGEAEVSLRKVKKDGTFLVRDSSKGCEEQPYTLMVLHQQKVYNIQIRFLGNKDGYSLGTGLNGIENYSSVAEMIMHHMKNPLFLIDGLDRGAGAQNQCCLMHPAGY
nr:lymphocyte cytosolic protein 2 isoform X2 [Danio rerio]XP_021330003.1 lymphocyte cytosolic protein 2 isoform X2 [Danio rerio]XP_021336903.1 lymphocyte cytosolic protein 2 isoform X2 [Danio rerio]|eukprot:XP_017214637.1 lymphocyte cytosolic protein 2 isoform X2 [Danio rerio]